MSTSTAPSHPDPTQALPFGRWVMVRFGVFALFVVVGCLCRDGRESNGKPGRDGAIDGDADTGADRLGAVG